MDLLGEFGEGEVEVGVLVKDKELGVLVTLFMLVVAVLEV